MSSFSVTVYPIHIEEHPNADRLSIASIPGQGYQFVVGKDQFTDGELFAYIPEAAIVPLPLLQEMGLEGMLDGSHKDRVKAKKLRGVLSQGLAYKPPTLPNHWVEGLDVTEELGITKYEPSIPAALQGRVKPAPRWRPDSPADSIWQPFTDVEHYKKYQTQLQVGEEVIITEKLHGTCLAVMVDGEQEYVSSLGIARRGFMLEEEEGNLYWQIARKYDLFHKLRYFFGFGPHTQAMLFGEIVGVQDLKYGISGTAYEFYAFDIKREYGFVAHEVFTACCLSTDIPMVPLLYKGPFTPEVLAEHTTGKTTLVYGALSHIREGVVVKPAVERSSPELSRVILKSFNADYLLRRAGTEFN